MSEIGCCHHPGVAVGGVCGPPLFDSSPASEITIGNDTADKSRCSLHDDGGTLLSVSLQPTTTWMQLESRVATNARAPGTCLLCIEKWVSKVSRWPAARSSESDVMASAGTRSTVQRGKLTVVGSG